MATCIKCGKPVGCGCQLTDGICEKCLAKIKVEEEKKKIKKDK